MDALLRADAGFARGGPRENIAKLRGGVLTKRRTAGLHATELRLHLARELGWPHDANEMDLIARMREAIAEAERARGTTGDNPWVGCVIVDAAGRAATP